MRRGGPVASSYGEDASKSALRDGYLAVQHGMTPSHKRRVDADILRHLSSFKAYRSAPLILAYYPCRGEIDVMPVIKRTLADGRRVALPRHVGGESSLEFRVISTLDGLVAGACGALEPPAWLGEPVVDVGELRDAVCLVPGLVFDARGYRIGYGAGYYDNFLVGFGGLKLGLVRALQISGNPLPIDGHDIAVDVLVSESAIWRCHRG
mgnify:FL=1